MNRKGSICSDEKCVLQTMAVIIFLVQAGEEWGSTVCKIWPTLGAKNIPASALLYGKSLEKRETVPRQTEGKGLYVRMYIHILVLVLYSI